jgi:hypothetical protein
MNIQRKNSHLLGIARALFSLRSLGPKKTTPEPLRSPFSFSTFFLELLVLIGENYLPKPPNIALFFSTKEKSNP